MFKLITNLSYKKGYYKSKELHKTEYIFIAQSRYVCKCGENIIFFMAPPHMCTNCYRVLPPINDIRYGTVAQRVELWKGNDKNYDNKS